MLERSLPIDIPPWLRAVAIVLLAYPVAIALLILENAALAITLGVAWRPRLPARPGVPDRARRPGRDRRRRLLGAFAVGLAWWTLLLWAIFAVRPRWPVRYTIAGVTWFPATLYLWS